MIRKFTLLIFFLTFAAVGDAEDIHPSFPKPTEPLIDRVHAGFGNRLDRYAAYFDSFFGGERAEEAEADTLVRLIGSTDYHEINGLDQTFRIKARINLPRLKQRVNLLIDTESDDTSTLADQTPPEPSASAQKKGETTLGLQLIQRLTPDFSINHRIGLSARSEGLNPKFRTQLRLTWLQSQRDLIRLTQALFWERFDGVGEETRLDFEHLLHRSEESDSLFRATLRGLFSETSDGYEWSLPIEVLTSLPNQRAYSFGGSISGVTHSDIGITNSAVFVRYRQSIWRPWFFFDLTPQIEWPKALGRNTTTRINLSLELIF